MNRNNIWIHIGLAVVLVTLAAVIGQIDRWKAALRTAPNIETPKVTIQPTRFGRDVAVSNAEVLVRFKPGVSLSAIKDIAAAKHDRVVDEIESVNELVAIDDLDNADPTADANEYAAMSDLVAYAEPNNVIQLDDPATGDKTFDVDSNQYDPNQPNDPQFTDQW